MDSAVAIRSRDVARRPTLPLWERLTCRLLERPALAIALTLGVIAATSLSIYSVVELRQFRRLDADRRTGIYAAPGRSQRSELLAYFSVGPTEAYHPIALDKVPRRLVQAVVAAEDVRFHSHLGIDPRGMARAAWVNFTSLRIRQGGSTITQQLVKLRLLTSDRTVIRKLREIWLALVLERFYSKEEILEAYLNEVNWGAKAGVSVRGVGAASRVYFGKALNELTVANAALLAAMIKAPNRYARDEHRAEVQARRDWILRRMREAGHINQREYARAAESPVRLGSFGVAPSVAGHFADMVRREAREQQPFSGSRNIRIITTLDRELQRLAESAVAGQLAEVERRFPNVRRMDPTRRLQAVLVALDPESGEIRALVGGRDYAASQFNRAVSAHRQPGSAFKPFVYSAALMSLKSGLTPASLVEDSPVTLKVKNTIWSPRNHGDRHEGWVTVRRALAGSLNAATIRIALKAGLDEVVGTAKRLGIETPLEPIPVLALGAVEVTPLELARAYLPFANGGWRPEAAPVIKAIDYESGAIRSDERKRERVLSPAGASLMTALLQDAVSDGTGRGARTAGMPGELAGKTGTTNDGRDAWFVGYSSRVLALVWVGFDDGTPHGLTAADAAVPIWTEFMRGASTVHRPTASYAAAAARSGPLR